MSETPRTDAVRKKAELYYASDAFDEVLHECAKIERELADMKKERDEALNVLYNAEPKWNEAKAQLKEFADKFYGFAIKENEKLLSLRVKDGFKISELKFKLDEAQELYTQMQQRVCFLESSLPEQVEELTQRLSDAHNERDALREYINRHEAACGMMGVEINHQFDQYQRCVESRNEARAAVKEIEGALEQAYGLAVNGSVPNEATIESWGQILGNREDHP